MSDAPPPFDSAQPFETMTAPAFDPSKPFSPFKAAEPEEGLKVPPAITDIWKETKNEAKAGASSVADLMNLHKMGNVEALTSVPKAAFGAGRVLLSPLTGLVNSVAGHTLANVERAAGENIVNPAMEHFGYKAQHPDEAEMYENAKGDFNKAMFGARPYGATLKPPGLMTYEPKLLEPPGTPPREPTPPPAPEPPMQEPPRQTLRPDAGVDLLNPDVPHTPRSDVRIRSLSAAGPGGPLSDISPETQAYLRKIMEDQGLNQNTLDDRLADMSAHHFFGEITPSLEADMGAIAAPPGPGKQEVLGSIRQRGAEKLERLQNTFDRAFGQNENVAQLKRLIDIDKQKAASPIYEQFRQTPIPPSPEVDAIIPRLEASGALRAANKALAEDGLPASQGFVEGPAANAFDEGTQVKQVPTAAAFDYAKQHLDGLINTAMKNEDANAARRYTQMKHDLDAALDAHPTAGRLWQQARDAYGGPTARQDAMKFGQRVLTNHVGADELPFLTAGYNDAQMQALRVGMRKFLEDKLGSRREVSADIFTSTLSPNNVQKIRWAIGDQAADELVTGMHHELHMHGAPTRIHGGSPTAHRLEAQKRWTVQPAPEGLTSDLGIKDAFHPGKTAARKAVEAVTKMGQAKKLAAAEAKAAKLREEAARVFTLQGPERDAAARHLLGGVGGTPRARGGRVSVKKRARARALGGAVQRAIRASKGYAEGGAPELSDDDQAAMMPETFANPYLKQTLARSLEASPPRDENVRFRTASPLVNITDEDIDRGVNIGMASGPGSIKGVGPGIRAYHGSPHDFDKFDLSKIGTGEGAQAYGHGLYFADSEGVAKSYKRPGPWSHRVDNTIDDIPASRFSPTDPVEQQAADALRRNTTVDEAVKYLQQDSGTEAAQDWLRQNAHRIKDANATGKMYEVNINADPSHFLDWDKPLSQQSQAVREKLTPEAIGLKPAGPLGDRGFYGYVDDKGRLVGRATTGRLPEEPFPGSEMASSIARGMGTWKPEEGAAALRQAGIPGIKYLDQGSRTAGAGSSNYVLFRDDIINIVKKYALAGIALPPAIAEAYDKMQNGRATGGAVSRAVRAAKGYETGGAPDYDPFAAETFLHPDLAGLSARTAQNDVGRLRDLASMEPSDRSAENIRFKTASPLVNITDEDIDRGINAGMATGPGAVRDPALWHGISSIRLPRPISEMSSVHVPTGTGKAEVIKPAALQNSRLLPLIGDRSVTGSDLTQVNGFKFADPVEMQGGHGFMAENADKDAAWASAQGVISGLAKKVRAEAGDQPIHGVYTAMGEQSADFSHHVSDTLAEMLKHTSGNRAAREAFDEAMQTATKDFPAAEDWPGIRSKKLRQYLADSPGKIRSKFAKTMDMAPYLNAGFPSVAEARLAVTDPRLLHEPTGASGLSVAKLDPSGRTFDVAGDQHRSYDTNLAGKYVGGLPVSVPKDVMYPDIMSALNKHAQATFDRTGFRPSTDYLMARTPKGLPVTQEANQKWVDGISKYLQDRGFARGGAVMRAVLASRARS